VRKPFVLFYFGRCGNFHQISRLLLEKLGFSFVFFLVENRDLFSKIAPEKESEKKNHMFVVEENERMTDLLGFKS
jgi:hypothetical protein